MRKPLLLLCLAAVLTAGGAAAPAPAAAARGLEVALQDDSVFLTQTWFAREAALQRARRLGVSRLRVNVLWSRVVARPQARRAPRHPTYLWGAHDALIADAARHGISLQLTLAGPAPAWATRNRRIGVVGPDPRQFAAFARAAATHFAGRVDRYAIWNEPNWHTWLSPSRSCRHGHWGPRCDGRLGRLYRRMYSRAYAAIDRVDSKAQVLFGELAPQGRPSSATAPLAFLRDVTCSRRDWRAARRCAGLRADGFAHHPYSFTADPHIPYGGPDDVVIGTLGRLTRALDRLAARGALRTPRGRPLDLFLTEYGYFSAGRRGVSQATRAAWLSRSFDIALRNRRVRQILQYLLVAPPRASDTFPTAIMTRRGRPMPPFRAIAKWVRRNRSRIARPRPRPRPEPSPPAPAPAPEAPPPEYELPVAGASLPVLDLGQVLDVRHVVGLG